MTAAIATLVLGFVLGFVGQRSRFCSVSGYRDYLLMRDSENLKGETREREIEARLPNGAVDSVIVKVAGVTPYLVMKSAALHSRIKQKDAYDIWFVLANYPGGARAVIEEFAPFVEHGLVRETVAILECKFESPDHFGPTSVAEFLEQADEDAQLTKRDAFERVQALLAGLRQPGGATLLAGK